MSAVRETDPFYQNIRDLAVKAKIDQAMIDAANIAYYRDIRILIVQAQSNPERIADLHDAIMRLPIELIRTLGITRAPRHQAIRRAILRLPIQLMEVLEGTIVFEAALTP